MVEVLQVTVIEAPLTMILKTMFVELVAVKLVLAGLMLSSASP